jgi:hypothetical protein
MALARIWKDGAGLPVMIGAIAGGPREPVERPVCHQADAVDALALAGSQPCALGGFACALAIGRGIGWQGRTAPEQSWVGTRVTTSLLVAIGMGESGQSGKIWKSIAGFSVHWRYSGHHRLCALKLPSAHDPVLNKSEDQMSIFVSRNSKYFGSSSIKISIPAPM